MGTMLALMNACPQFMKAFDEAPRTVLTKVVTRQLGVNGFDIRNPLLALQHDLGYPATLEWNNSPAFTAGLKILYGITHGGRKSCPICAVMLLSGTILMSSKVRY